MGKYDFYIFFFTNIPIPIGMASCLSIAFAIIEIKTILLPLSAYDRPVFRTFASGWSKANYFTRM